MSGKRRVLGLLPAAVLVAGVFGACTDETIIYRDFPLYDEPVEAALGFVGYSSVDSKLPVCGNCHVSAQTQWSGTAHAGAWDGLQDSGHAQEFCEGCHTVNELGNIATEIAGHTATGEEKYYDVQCESCHGPGLAHVETPDGGTGPLAHMDVIFDSTGVDASAPGCAQCHTGDHHPYAEEWANSSHANMNPYPQGRDGCNSCHTGQGALAMWGENTSYVEEGSGEALNITCAVCHDPHGSENTAQLRQPIEEPDENINLCMQCHHKRGAPDPTSFRGPHSPEGPTLLGTAGWWPPDLEQPILSTHGSTTENPRLCAGCHVNSYEVTDDVSGEFLFNATGHSFEATPCVDASGVPTAGPCDDSSKTYTACTDCHDAAVAQGLVTAAKASIVAPMTTLDSLLQLVDSAEFDPDDDRYTVAEGSLFNLELAEKNGSVIHNAFLIRALLDASIAEVRNRYGL